MNIVPKLRPGQPTNHVSIPGVDTPNPLNRL